jgi:alkylation response protein AidB-like acyl-CoA dehydrogenase
MDFNLTKEQEQLSDTIQRFVAKEYTVERRKAILASKEGFSREVWAKLGELGLLALQVPEEHGGMGAGAVEVLLTMNAIGKGLLLEPFLPSAILGTALVRELGSPEQQRSILPRLAAGELIVVPAHGEAGARYDLERVATKATASVGATAAASNSATAAASNSATAAASNSATAAASNSAKAAASESGFVLEGNKTVVLHAPAADLLIVSARTSGKVDDEAGISLFVVPRDAPGVSLLAYPTMDGQRAADVTLHEVRVPRSSLLGPLGGALPTLAAVFDLGLAALCAEAVGALQASLDATLEYTKTRKQFGQPIGKFQALQHRMADMFIHVEQARSMSYLAAMRCTDSDAAARRRAVSAAKVLVGQACRYVGQQSIQLHGGMGMTDELLISHHFRRLAAIELSLGDTEHHLEQFVRSAEPQSDR